MPQCGIGVKRVRIDGLLPQQLFQIQSKYALEYLNAGDMIEGRIAAIRNGLLLIRLLDGSSFSASVPEGFDAPPGTMLTLQIGEPLGDRITARVVRMDMPSGQESWTSNNIDEISGKLEQFGAKATDALVSKVLELIDENPELGTEKAAFIAANGMETDRAMLEMAVKLAEREYSISENLSTLGKLLTGLFSQTERENLESILKPVLLELETQQAVRGLAESLLVLHNTETADAGSAGKAVPQGSAEDILTGKLLDVLKEYISGQKIPEAENIFVKLKETVSDFGYGRDAQTDALSFEDGRTFEVLGKFAADFVRIHENADSLFKEETPDVKSIIDRILDKAYVKAEDGKADTDDLQNKAGIIKRIISLAADAAKISVGNGNHAIHQTARELSDALRFFSQVSTYHVFMQIPVMVNGNKTAGQLYIMKRRSGKKRFDPEQFTLFMSLKTQNLGLVETFLNASRGCVTIHFRVENSELADFVKAHRSDLYEALMKKGYRLAEMKCRVFEGEPVNLLNAEKATETVLGMNARVDLRI